MSGQFDFRDNRYVALSGIGNDIPHVLLRVKPAVASVSPVIPTGTGVQPEADIIAPGTQLGEFRIFPDGNPPSLVIHEVPVEYIEFVSGHDIDKILNFVYRKKVTADVEVKPTPGKTRHIRDGHGGNDD